MAAMSLIKHKLMHIFWQLQAGMGTRRKSSRLRRDRDVCSSRDVIETLKNKFY